MQPIQIISFSDICVFDVDNQPQKVKCAHKIGINNFKNISLSKSLPNPRALLHSGDAELSQWTNQTSTLGFTSNKLIPWIDSHDLE